ncbi:MULTISPECIES: hypothetical protein [unclassified Synechocystis]|nr:MULTISPECIES: hypothetical protein [unclassified Synechocystis]
MVDTQKNTALFPSTFHLDMPLMLNGDRLGERVAMTQRGRDKT